MPTTCTFSLKAGSAYRRAGEGWERVTLRAADVGGAALIVVPVEIDGAPCALFRARDGHQYAQSLTVAVDPETIPNATEGQPPPTQHRS